MLSARATIILSMLVWIGAVAAIVIPVFAANHHAPAFHSVDNPNCFPQGTKGVDEFPMCRDDLRLGLRNT